MVAAARSHIIEGVRPRLLTPNLSPCYHGSLYLLARVFPPAPLNTRPAFPSIVIGMGTIF